MASKSRKSKIATGTKNNVINPPVPFLRLRIFGVRDPKLAFGGRLVPDLTELKRQLMKTATENEWMLVLAIHASPGRLAAQIPGQPNHDVYYNTNKIAFIFSDTWRSTKAAIIEAAGTTSLVGQKWWDEIFEDEDEFGPRDLPAKTAVEKLAGLEGWDAWRRAYGPTHIVLVGCQVTKDFEGIVLSHFLRPGVKQEARGLGAGRKPLTDSETVRDFRKRKVTTRKEYRCLPKEERDWILATLQKRNAEFGYYGGPPVKNEDVLEYYFDVEPKGEWVKVTVGRVVHGQKQLVDTGIPFFTR